jgi:hypothetical protein
VVEWGQRGTLQLAKILDQASGPVSAETVAAAEHPPSSEAAMAGSSTEHHSGGTGARLLKPVRSGEIEMSQEEKGMFDGAEEHSVLKDPPEGLEPVAKKSKGK